MHTDRRILELARTCTVHWVDLPGVGGLPKPSAAPTVPVLAEALARVLDRLGVRHAVVVGHSMGTQWAIELGVQRPDLAAAVVAIGLVADREHRLQGTFVEVPGHRHVVQHTAPRDVSAEIRPLISTITAASAYRGEHREPEEV